MAKKDLKVIWVEYAAARLAFASMGLLPPQWRYSRQYLGHAGDGGAPQKPQTDWPH